MIEATNLDILEPRLVTIPAKNWDAFKAWAHRPPRRIPALEELARTGPKWTE